MELRQIKKYVSVIILSLGFTVASASAVWSAEITAIDFNGNVIGQVISTGLVINSNGENIGSITADSLIINTAGEVIGGVVPQGIVIGNDNRLLGKIHTDGVIRSLTGKNLGKALPNGLVINSDSRIIGSILYPGLVYSSNGDTIGRVTGAGTYANLEGQEIGFVSANGYAYRQSGNDYILDGRLMSSKMVVSLEGAFIGSIAPSGKVIDFEGREIGTVRANDYVYNGAGMIVGRVVRTSYAFDLAGRYMGVVTYNGTVVNGEQTVGRYRADGNIVDTNQNVIGFAVNISATANDNNGNYLGRITPFGWIVDAGNIVGRVGAKGFVYNQAGSRIGELIETGPIFDVLGNLKGQSMHNGSVISLTGNVIGRMRGKYAYDTNGVLIGGISQNMLAYSNTDMSLGMVNIGSEIVNGAETQKVSPFGYMFNSDGKVVGRSFNMSALYSMEGLLYSYINPNGALYRTIGDVKLSQGGVLIGKNGFVSSLASPLYAIYADGKSVNIFTNTNLLAGPTGEISDKVVPGGYIVQSGTNIVQNLTPIRGFYGNSRVAISTSGDLLGYADSEAKINDLNGTVFGNILYSDYVSDNNQSVVGRLVPFTVVHNDKCDAVGVVNGRGEVVNGRSVVVGRMLTNGQAISDVGTFIGYSIEGTGLIDEDGNYVGTVNSGVGISFTGRNLGCVNRHGTIIDGDNKLRFSVISANPVIDFDNKIIGQILANGSVVDQGGQIIGYVQPTGDVVSKSKKLIGQSFKYRVAYKNDNTFLGMVQISGVVLNQKGEVVGQVNFDGSVSNEEEVIGYALYDFYVYDDNFATYGYVTKDGTVLNFVGSKLGRMDKGFVLDKRNQVIARGNRDYIVRDTENNAVGELQLDGNVIGFGGENIGYLAKEGDIRNANGDVVARAYPLQYYVHTVKEVETTKKDTKESNRDWADYKRVEIQDAEDVDYEPTAKKGLGKKIVGIALNPDGDIIGNIYEDDRVFNDDGVQIGFRTPEGIIVDMDYNPVGIEEIQHASANNMFIPAGAFGSGNAYGIGSQPSNLGPGGGYGQGERYDKARAMALTQAQNMRRQEVSVGKISSGISVSSFTGYEEDGWPGVPKNISTWRVDMSQMILEDKPIPAVLARSVYASNGFGDNIPVTAIVERNIYTEEGRNIIIPAGTRVIGRVGGATSGGSNGGAVKIAITWKRMIRPDGAQFTFGGAQTADPQGRAGAIGYLDEQLMKKYTTPILMTALESTTAYMMAAGVAGPSEGSEAPKAQAANDARQNFIEQMNNIFNEIIESKRNIQAVTYMPAGTRVIIFPNEDLWLKNEKPDEERGEVGGRNGSGTGLTEDNPSGNRGGDIPVNTSQGIGPVPAGRGQGGSSLVDENPGGGRAGRLPPPQMQQEEEVSDIPDLL